MILQSALIIVICVSGLALGYALLRARWIYRQPAEGEALRRISGYVARGAMTFLAREYRVLIPFILITSAFLAFVNRGYLSLQALTFVLGAACSALAGFIGMKVATASNSRTTHAAQNGIAPALRIAFAGGSIMGLCVVGLALFGIFLVLAISVFLISGQSLTALGLPLLSGFSLGSSSIALFTRVGGGIYTKAADIGADLVGICRAHPNLIYSHEYDLFQAEHRPLDLPEGCTHAIVMVIEMDYDTMKYSPDAIAGTATGLGYSKMAFLTNLVAAFIRGLGYRAIPSGNDTGLSIPLAMAAGLGELGRNGLLITEKYGPRVRICKVFTDLPLLHDTYRPFGVAPFCESCKKCADRCPSGAISHDEPTTQGPSFSNHSGVEKWYIDPERCFLFWVKNWMDCSHCIKVCPFNKPQGIVHDAARVAIQKMPRLNRLLVWMDDMLGYGKSVKSKNFWET